MWKKRGMDTRSLVVCALFAALIAVGAFIKIPIPYLSMTMQVFFVNLAAILLGAKRAVWAVVVYVALGLAGLPIFSAGGGIGYVFRPSFGYLIGFGVGAGLAGWMVDRVGRPGKRWLMLASLVNLAAIYAFGMTYYVLIMKYYLGTPIAAKALWTYCFLTVIPGDIVSCLISVYLYARLKPLVR